MDCYAKLINEIQEKLEYVNSRIKAVENELHLNFINVNAFMAERADNEEKVSEMSNAIQLLENYDFIISNIRKKYLKKLLMKTGIVIGLTIINIILLHGITPVLVPTIAGMLMELLVLKYQNLKFTEETAEIEELKEEHTIPEIKYELAQLQDLNKELFLKIKFSIARKIELRKELKKLKEIKEDLSVGQGILSAKRESLIMAIIEANEGLLDGAFAEDKRAIDILKLERGLE